MGLTLKLLTGIKFVWYLVDMYERQGECVINFVLYLVDMYER